MCLHPFILRNTSNYNPAKRKQELERHSYSVYSSHLFRAVPCGKCVDCLKHRANDLFFRAYQSVRLRPASYFITLTYSEDVLPYNLCGPTLVKSDIEKFIKRINYNYSKYLGADYGSQFFERKNILNYVYCGEYGRKFHRPHYHLIVMFRYMLSPEEVYDLVEDSWLRGCRIDIAPAELATIRYTLKYMFKDSFVVKNEKNDGFVKPFSNWSQSLGIEYVNKENALYHYNNETWTTFIEGTRFLVPKYLRKKFEQSNFFPNDEKTWNLFTYLQDDSFNDGLVKEDLLKYIEKYGLRDGLNYKSMQEDIKRYSIYSKLMSNSKL